MNASSAMRRQSDRAFGLTFAVVFTVITVIGWLVFDRFASWAVALAIGFAAVAAVKPGLLMPFNRLWMVFARTIAPLSNGLILGAVFVLVITPLGLVLRMRRTDPLRRGFDRAVETYWSPVAQRGSQEHFSDLF